MMTENSHRARDVLIRAGKMIPGVWSFFEAERAKRAYPPYIYIDDGDGANAYIEARLAHYGSQFVKTMRSLDVMKCSIVMSPFVTFAAWRMTQGIYRVDPALYAAIVNGNDGCDDAGH
jgi:hypothetical protein